MRCEYAQHGMYSERQKMTEKQKLFLPFSFVPALNPKLDSREFAFKKVYSAVKIKCEAGDILLL